MAPLSIDFARPRPRMSAWAWLVLLLGLAGAGAALTDFLAARAELQAAQTTTDAAERDARARRTTDRAPAPEVPPAVLRAAVNARTALERPWGLWLSELENRSTPSVALLGIDTVSATRRMRLTAEVRSMRDAVTYVESLVQSPLVEAATIAGHERRDTDGVTVLRVSIDVNWAAETP